jgi:hypothetical protein
MDFRYSFREIKAIRIPPHMNEIIALPARNRSKNAPKKESRIPILISPFNH